MPQGERGDRTKGHVHCGATYPKRRSNYAGFTKPGVNVYIQLDGPTMLRDGNKLNRSATGVLLVPQVVDPRYFLEVNAMPDKLWQGRGPRLRL